MCGPRPSLRHPTLHAADNLALPTKSSKNIGAEAVSAFFGQFSFFASNTTTQGFSIGRDELRSKPCRGEPGNPGDDLTT